MIQYTPFRVHEITVDWSNPIRWDKVTEYQKDWDGGLYYITRRIHMEDHDSITRLYIGKASGRISKRILQHTLNDSKCPFIEKRGDFEVRFGRIVSPLKYKKRFHFNRLLLTIESALINEVCTTCNVSQTNRYTRWYRLIIHNIGKRDDIPAIIDNRDHVNASPPKDWDGSF